jgi:hypothetical protein
MVAPSDARQVGNAAIGFAGLASLVSVLPKPAQARIEPTVPRRSESPPAVAEAPPNPSPSQNQPPPLPTAPPEPPQTSKPSIWTRYPALLWIAFAGIGALIYLGKTASNSPSYQPAPTYTAPSPAYTPPSPAYTPPPQQAYIPPTPKPYVPPPAAPPVLTEVRPSGGVNPVLSASEIVYCLSEAIRLEAIRGMMDNTSQRQVDSFNVRVDSYNALCSSYRYMNNDMDRAKASVASRRSLLQTEAAGTVARWR